MKMLLLILLMLAPVFGSGEELQIWQLLTKDGTLLTEISTQPHIGDEYIGGDNALYRIVSVDDTRAYAQPLGVSAISANGDNSVNVMAEPKHIALYCTHSDECYEPSDGFYSTRKTGSIYHVARRLMECLSDQGVDAVMSMTLHHPHDAGAYRRSRQTAVQLLTNSSPDCLIDVHRDGIPDPASYAVKIKGQDVSKIRLLVGLGNQNAQINKAFAIKVKAIADECYPGLIKDIYLGKGSFNQDLLPRSLLLECGTYTLEKERVLLSMPMLAEVLVQALYGGTAMPHTQDSQDNENLSSNATVHENAGVDKNVVMVFLLGIVVVSFSSLKFKNSRVHER